MRTCMHALPPSFVYAYTVAGSGDLQWDPTYVRRKEYMAGKKRALFVKTAFYALYTLYFLLKVTVGLVSLFLDHPLAILQAFHLWN